MGENRRKHKVVWKAHDNKTQAKTAPNGNTLIKQRQNGSNASVVSVTKWNKSHVIFALHITIL